jgi:hypothetical protein
VSKNNSRKETLFSLYIKINQHKLEQALKLEFRTLVMEKCCGNRRIDMTGIDMLGRKIHIEWQLDLNFKTHFIQVQDLILAAPKYESTIIVWGAVGTKEDLYIELLQNIVFNSEKNIELIFLQINDEVLGILSEINQMKQLEQIKELDRLNLIQPIFINIKGIKNYNSLKIKKAQIEEGNIVYSYEERLMINILMRLREDFPECSNIHKYKNIKDKKNFGIGSGFQDIGYKVSCCDRRKRVSIENMFSNYENICIFNRLFDEEKEKIDSEFNYILKWDRNFHRIGTYFPRSAFVNENTVKIFCRIVKLYIIGFDKHIRKAIEGIKENQ